MDKDLRAQGGKKGLDCFKPKCGSWRTLIGSMYSGPVNLRYLQRIPI
jgi:hypothetical protein